MQRAIQHIRTIVEDVLRAVAAVDVPIGDQDAIQVVFRLGIARCDGDVVEQAEALPRSGMAWWPGGRTMQNAVPTA